MRLWQEIREQLNDGPPDGVVTGALYTVWEDKGGYFQNIRSLGAFSPQEVVLCLRRGTLRVAGENLCVAKYCESDVFIRGSIFSVAREGSEGKNGGGA